MDTIEIRKTAEELGPKLVGMTYEDASLETAKHNLRLRATSYNGQPCIVTMDLRFDRINVSVDNNIVTSYNKVG